MSARLAVAVGERFGILTVVNEPTSVLKGNKRRRCCECRCDCGNTATVPVEALRRGNNSSCGCRMNQGTHGQTSTPEYRAWKSMRDRCQKPHHHAYADYGGRGVTVCAQWGASDSFPRFLADVGPRPSSRHSLDRIDNSRGYEPGNCRWATSRQQNLNTRANVRVTHNGETLTLSEWAERAGQSVGAFSQRLKRGWSMGDALRTPTLERWSRKAGARHAA